MKISELISILNKLSPELDVVVNGREGGVDDCSRVETVLIKRDVNTSWYFGAHEVQAEPGENAVLIR